MALAIAISLFFGLVAAFALASCFGSLKAGYRQYRSITADLVALDRAQAVKAAPVRRPTAAFVQAHRA